MTIRQYYLKDNDKLPLRHPTSPYFQSLCPSHGHSSTFSPSLLLTFSAFTTLHPFSRRHNLRSHVSVDSLFAHEMLIPISGGSYTVRGQSEVRAGESATLAFCQRFKTSFGGWHRPGVNSIYKWSSFNPTHHHLVLISSFVFFYQMFDSNWTCPES